MKSDNAMTLLLESHALNQDLLESCQRKQMLNEDLVAQNKELLEALTGLLEAIDAGWEPEAEWQSTQQDMAEFNARRAVERAKAKLCEPK